MNLLAFLKVFCFQNYSVIEANNFSYSFPASAKLMGKSDSAIFPET